MLRLKSMGLRSKTLIQIYLTGVLLLLAGFMWSINIYVSIGSFLYSNYLAYFGLKNYKDLIIFVYENKKKPSRRSK